MILACDSAATVQGKENFNDCLLVTSNVLPLHFAPSQASSNQNSSVDSYLQYCEVDSLKPS